MSKGYQKPRATSRNAYHLSIASQAISINAAEVATDFSKPLTIRWFVHEKAMPQTLRN